MNREDIIRMAREARFAEGMDWGHEIWEAKTGNLERFAALVAAAEREACAKVCDVRAEGWKNSGTSRMGSTTVFCLGEAQALAAEIRLRGEMKESHYE
ncbi:MAG: hypothetical protein ACK528_10320 [Alphaproteobacteria bacterium]